jgi:hypothetical protein
VASALVNSSSSCAYSSGAAAVLDGSKKNVARPILKLDPAIAQLTSTRSNGKLLVPMSWGVPVNFWHDTPSVGELAVKTGVPPILGELMVCCSRRAIDPIAIPGSEVL